MMATTKDDHRSNIINALFTITGTGNLHAATVTAAAIVKIRRFYLIHPLNVRRALLSLSVALAQFRDEDSHNKIMHIFQPQ